jgi:pimeloyl-ACP methyl ester carboxylesterase
MGQTVECGYLTVPEDRSRPDGPTIRLHVAMFKSRSFSPKPDPVVYLAGGPGEKALASVPLAFNERFSPFLEHRDFIMFDQRGVGFSEPALDCQEYVDMVYDILDQDLDVAEEKTLTLQAMSACRDRLTSEGVDLAAYTSAESAADLDDLRSALGYDEWNLYGISYGTRLAMTAMRDFPEGIRSVILDSSYPLQIDLYESLPAGAARAFNALFSGCAADPKCDAAYPDLEATFFLVVEQLNESPVTLSVTNPLTGKSYDVLVNGDSLIGFVFELLYSANTIPLLPELIYDVHDGDYDITALLLGASLADLEFSSKGMYFSVECGEEAHFSDQEEVSAASDAYPQLRGVFSSDSVFEICGFWGARDADPIENELVNSHIPTLVLSGEYDPITPPAFGNLVAETLDNSFVFEFPGIGHGASVSSECALSIALMFLDDPESKPDASCITPMSGPAFVVSGTEMTLVPFEDELFGISGIVPEGWDEIVPGTYSRSEMGFIGIIQQSVTGIGPGQILVLLSAQFGLDDVPDAAATREANNLGWTLYEFETGGQPVDLALAEGGGTTYLVLLMSVPSKRGFYYDEVYLPAIDALTSVGE